MSNKNLNYHIAAVPQAKYDDMIEPLHKSNSGGKQKSRRKRHCKSDMKKCQSATKRRATCKYCACKTIRCKTLKPPRKPKTRSSRFHKGAHGNTLFH